MVILTRLILHELGKTQLKVYKLQEKFKAYHTSSKLLLSILLYFVLIRDYVSSFRVTIEYFLEVKRVWFQRKSHNFYSFLKI